jgi:hypothetical protein
MSLVEDVWFGRVQRHLIRTPRLLAASDIYRDCLEAGGH